VGRADGDVIIIKGRAISRRLAEKRGLIPAEATTDVVENERELIEAMRGAKSVISAEGTVTLPDERVDMTQFPNGFGVSLEDYDVTAVAPDSEEIATTSTVVVEDEAPKGESFIDPTKLDPTTGLPMRFGTVPAGPPPFQIGEQFTKIINKDLAPKTRRKVGSR
jgi:hypothetical protein